MILFFEVIDTKKPGILYVFGLEILEFYFSHDEIIGFVVQILKDLAFISKKLNK